MKWGSSSDMLITQTPRNLAKLQLMIYAMIFKSENPDVKFRDLSVAWIPSKTDALMYDHRAKVEVKQFIEMIEKVFKNEMKENGVSMYDHLKANMTAENFRKLFDYKEYDGSAEIDAKNILDGRDALGKMEADLEGLRKNVLYNHALPNSDSHREAMKNAQAIFDKMLKYQDKIPGGFINVQDISLMSLYLGSNATMKSEYLQYWERILRERKQKANETYNEMRAEFLALQRPMIDDYHRAYGKSITENIPFLKGALNFFSTKKMWHWLYVDKIDAATGEVVGKKMRTTEQEWEDAKRVFPELSN